MRKNLYHGRGPSRNQPMCECGREAVSLGLCLRHYSEARRRRAGAKAKSAPNEVIIDGETTWIILTGYARVELARTAIDTADLSMVRQLRRRVVLSGQGYASVNDVGLLHRIICECDDDSEVDHIDRDRLNNRRANLRAVSTSQNAQNKPATGVTGHRNVYAAPNGRWRVQLHLGNKFYSGGYFDHIEDAILVAESLRHRLMPFAIE